MAQFNLRYVGGKFRGYPIGTIAYYGQDGTTATKAVASVIKTAGQPASQIHRWTGEDLINDDRTQRKIRDFFSKHGVKTVLATDRPIVPTDLESSDAPAPAPTPTPAEQATE